MQVTVKVLNSYRFSTDPGKVMKVLNSYDEMMSTKHNMCRKGGISWSGLKG